MGTAAPFVKLLRQLASAKDDYRTGALDITWDGGRASLFLVFGQPNHAVLEVGGRRLEGAEALAALVTQLPPRFELSPWRKEVVQIKSLSCTLDELMEPFAQLAGAASPGDVSPARPGGSGAADGGSVPEIDFGLADFPLLPLGPSLWSDASASVVHLDVLIPSLPDALVVLTGPKLRAAAVVVRQQLIDAVWVDEEDRMVGEAAAMALMGARDGSVSGYRLETPKLAEALTMLWRCRAVYREMPASWVNAGSLLEDLEGRRRDSAIVVTGGVRGVALVAGGKLLGVYSETDRQPLASPERLTELLSDPRARVTLRQSPEERQVDHFPETAYHAFVADATEAPAPLSEALAALTSSGRYAASADLATDSSGSAASASEPELTPEEHEPAEEEPGLAVEADGFAAEEPEFAAEGPEFAAAAPEFAAEEPEFDAEAPEPTTETPGLAAEEPEFAAQEPEFAAQEPEFAAEEMELTAEGPEPAAAEAVAHAAQLVPASAQPAPAKLVMPADLTVSAQVRAPADPMAAQLTIPAPAEERRAPSSEPAPVAWPASPVEPVPTVPVDLGGAAGGPAWPPIPLTDVQEGEGTLTAWGQPYSQAPAPSAAPRGPAEFPEFESSPALEALAAADASADFEGMKADLIQIGSLWLGTDGVAPVAEMLRRTRPSIQDVMATIEAIKHVALPGFETSVVQAMAREMHYHAAEYLSGL
jgi:hypothetical protein